MLLIHRDDLEREIRSFFDEDPRDLVCVYLFGSQARGTAHASSDVNLGLLFEHEPPRAFAALPLGRQADLEQRLGMPVQLVVMNRAPADLVHRILRDGQLLVDRKPSRRISFEVKRRNEFFDLQPILRDYRRPRSRPA